MQLISNILLLNLMRQAIYLYVAKTFEYQAFNAFCYKQKSDFIYMCVYTHTRARAHVRTHTPVFN